MAQPSIVIVGAGFGGLAAAKALKNAPAEITLIDRTNPFRVCVRSGCAFGHQNDLNPRITKTVSSR